MSKLAAKVTADKADEAEIEKLMEADAQSAGGDSGDENEANAL